MDKAFCAGEDDIPKFSLLLLVTWIFLDFNHLPYPLRGLLHVSPDGFVLRMLLMYPFPPLLIISLSPHRSRVSTFTLLKKEEQGGMYASQVLGICLFDVLVRVLVQHKVGSVVESLYI